MNVASVVSFVWDTKPDFPSGNGSCQRSFTRKARPQLGRTLQDHVMAEEGHLPPRDAGRTETSTPIEHGAPSEILSVEVMDGDVPLFPSLFNFTTTSFLFLKTSFATIFLVSF